jgi:hypothetical protein
MTGGRKSLLQSPERCHRATLPTRPCPASACRRRTTGFRCDRNRAGQSFAGAGRARREPPDGRDARACLAMARRSRPLTKFSTTSARRPFVRSRIMPAASAGGGVTIRSAIRAAGESPDGMERSIPKTRAPMRRPICTAAPPTPPLAPITTRVSAGCSAAYLDCEVRRRTGPSRSGRPDRGDDRAHERAQTPEQDAVRWLEEIEELCREAGAAFFFRQWGGRNKKAAGRTLNGRT